MAKLEKLLSALLEGHSARREGWEPIVRMFVENGTLMCQCGLGKPWRWALGWDEMIATDWHLIQEVNASGAEQVLVAQQVAAQTPARASWNFLSKAKERYLSSIFMLGSKQQE